LDLLPFQEKYNNVINSIDGSIKQGFILMVNNIKIKKNRTFVIEIISQNCFQQRKMISFVNDSVNLIVMLFFG